MIRMLTDRFVKVEKELIGETWQNNELAENMYVMADVIGSRFPGTPSEKEAQEYMLKKFKEYGYDNARAEPFTYYGWQRGQARLEMVEPLQREFQAISLAMSPGGIVTAEVIDMGTGSPEEFEDIDPADVKGKIVMCSSATSPNRQPIRTGHPMAAKQTFEKAMKQLEQIVQELESGDLPLERAIQKFEEGIRLTRFCTEKLDETEKRVTLLMEDTDGRVAETPFQDHEA